MKAILVAMLNYYYLFDPTETKLPTPSPYGT